MKEGRLYVRYCRVSTDKQGRSGLGLEAQKAAITAHLGPQDRLLEPVFVEIESGRKQDRPELAKALHWCRETGGTLIVAKLDRLARNLAFIANLMESGVGFLAADMPLVNRLTLHILAAVAEEEARAIPARTKAALAAAKARGVKLGGDSVYRPATGPDQAQGTQAAAQARSLRAAQFRARVRPQMEALAEPGMSLRELARKLNQAGLEGPRGKPWNHQTVKAVMRCPTQTTA
jgi:DNA invertase Pin-like site-specific DNA recombinase